ncbi:MAG TPA: histidinol-phosphatase HisJ family protein [Dehalococcoidia bacterium]|nr:histidinol-phosphatase HisJ family protein [Dehalococcoidia bacterium]
MQTVRIKLARSGALRRVLGLLMRRPAYSPGPKRAMPDHHVHSEWSWDAVRGSMDETCRRAVALGLPSIAFTEHADWSRGEDAVVDMPAYLECIERCRAAYPSLRIMSGVELGEPHLHSERVREILGVAPLDRVLGSLHFVKSRERSGDASEKGFLHPDDVDEMFRGYLREMVTMLESDVRFEVLAHLDYPKRYWPQQPAFDESRFEDDLRTVLRAAARRGVALEINTTRGRAPERYLCPGPRVLRWWYEEGGGAVAFGSDAHSADKLAAGFDLAAEVAEAAGFKPQDDPSAFWLR